MAPYLAVEILGSRALARRREIEPSSTGNEAVVSKKVWSSWAKPPRRKGSLRPGRYAPASPPRNSPVLIRFWLNDDGATSIEYCLIASLISLALIAGATTIGTKLQTKYFQAAANGLS